MRGVYKAPKPRDIASLLFLAKNYVVARDVDEAERLSSRRTLVCTSATLQPPGRQQQWQNSGNIGNAYRMMVKLCGYGRKDVFSASAAKQCMHMRTDALCVQQSARSETYTIRLMKDINAKQTSIV